MMISLIHDRKESVKQKAMPSPDVSFIFLADGPCTAASFRPEEDYNQYWCRRDALVRITHAALYNNQAVCDDVAFMYIDNGSNDDNDKSESISGKKRDYNEISNNKNLPVIGVICMSDKIKQYVPIPTEGALIKSWKESVIYADHHNDKKLILSSVFNTNCRDIDSNSNRRFDVNQVQNSSVIVTSNNAWTEIVLIPQLQHLVKPLVATSDDIVPPNSNMETLDKRQLLRILQSQCPLSFLREHNLNSNEAIVLKKTNFNTMKDIYIKWCQQQRKMEVVAPSSGNVTLNEHENKLRDTFLVLLYRNLYKHYIYLKSNGLIAASTSVSDVAKHVTVLLLHEDYPVELPVFGDKPNSSNVDKVICIFGAVRDMTNNEVKFLLIAAEFLQIKVVGCNLGRTAEFTSKIVTSVISHACNHRFINACKMLPVVSSVNYSTKLDPLRGWTWDGSSTITTTSTISSIKSTAILEVVYYAPYVSDDISLDIEHRGKFLPLIQLIISTLWRSKVLAETNQAAGASYSHDQVTILFDDNSIYTIRLVDLSPILSANHMAAPIEYNILFALQKLLIIGTSCMKKCSNTDSLSDDDLILSILPGDYKHKSDRKLIQVIDINCHKCEHDGADISSAAYDKPCTCTSDTIDLMASSTGIPHIIVFFRTKVSIDRYSHDDFSNLVLSFIYGKTKHKSKNRFYCNSSGLGYSMAQVVTILQHYHYHGRLLPSLHL